MNYLDMIKESLHRYGYIYVNYSVVLDRMAFSGPLGTVTMDLGLLEWFISVSDSDVPLLMDIEAIRVRLIRDGYGKVSDMDIRKLKDMLLRRLYSGS